MIRSIVKRWTGLPVSIGIAETKTLAKITNRIAMELLEHLGRIIEMGKVFPALLWSPNHQFVPVEVMGVTDPDGHSVTITVTSVTQDEPVKSNRFDPSPDAVVEGGSTLVRAERLGTGNGPVYEISFRARDEHGGFCTGVVTVSIPHSLNKGLTAINDRQLYDSTVP